MTTFKISKKLIFLAAAFIWGQTNVFAPGEVRFEDLEPEAKLGVLKNLPRALTSLF